MKSGFNSRCKSKEGDRNGARGGPSLRSSSVRHASSATPQIQPRRDIGVSAYLRKLIAPASETTAPLAFKDERTVVRILA